MTTPSGANSAQDVVNEFGLGKPTSFSSFYGLGGAPSSGPISLGDMRNRTSVVFSPANSSPVASGVNSAGIALSCNVSAVWTFSLPGAVSASLASGASGTGVTFTKSTRGDATFSVTATANGRSMTWNVTLSVGNA